MSRRSRAPIWPQGKRIGVPPAWVRAHPAVLARFEADREYKMRCLGTEPEQRPPLIRAAEQWAAREQRKEVSTRRDPDGAGPTAREAAAPAPVEGSS